MKIVSNFLAILILFGFAVSAKAISVGEAAPDFKISDIKGKEISISENRGKIIVLEWTNPQCPFVKKQYDSGNMQAMQKKYTEAGIIWISVNSSAEGREGYFANNKDAEKYIEESKASPTNYIRDFNGDIGKSFRATTTPHMFIIDKDGKIAYIGAVDSIPSANKDDVAKAENYVSKALDEIIAGKEISKQTSTAYGCSVKY